MEKKKKKKTPTDINELAKFITDQTTCVPISGDTKEPATVEDMLSTDIAQKALSEGKNPLAAYLGQRGGQKGGKARAEKLSAKKRKEIAKKAAAARWRQTHS